MAEFSPQLSTSLLMDMDVLTIAVDIRVVFTLRFLSKNGFLILKEKILQGNQLLCITSSVAFHMLNIHETIKKTKQLLVSC